MMKLISLILILSSAAFASVHLKSKLLKSDHAAYAKNLDLLQNSQWPYNVLSIGHSMQSYQNYGNSPYWHDGLDIRGEKSQKVYATVSGKVVNIENYYPGDKLYWEVAILDDSGFVWKFHHVDHTSIPQTIRDAYKSGKRIQRGEHIGNIVPWPMSAYGEVYHHIHLLIVDGEKRYVNPFKLLPPLPDTSNPVIQEIGIFNSRRNKLETNEVSGLHGIYIKLYDTILHSQFKLTPYMITYQLDQEEEKTIWKFDYLPSMTNDTDYLNDFYLKNTCGNYRCRDFYINLNFEKNYNSTNTRLFNLKEGAHTIIVNAYDFAGNTVTKSYDYNVR